WNPPAQGLLSHLNATAVTVPRFRPRNGAPRGSRLRALTRRGRRLTRRGSRCRAPRRAATALGLGRPDRRLDAFALALAADPRRRGADALGTLAVLHPGHALQVAPGRIRTVLARTVVVR